jgi:outer membrane immunogenic protein
VEFDGGIAGGHIGADRQLGPLVLGVVGDLEWADGSGVQAAADVFGKAEANWQGSIRGRVGAAFNRILLYGTGGFAFANYDFDFTFTGAPLFGAFGDEFSDIVAGWTAGGGAAVKFGAWEFWGDYRFSDYGKTSSDITNCCAPPPFAQDHDVSTQAVRVGVSRRFGGAVPPP